MALPNVDKPDINDSIQDILTDISENCSYLDTEPSAYSVRFLKRAFSAGSGSEVVTVGFQPRVVISFSNTAYGASSIGYYGPSDSYTNMRLYKVRYLIGGSYYNDLWNPAGGYSMQIYVNYDGSLINVYGYVVSVSTTGFTWGWNMNRNQLAPAVDPEINVVCLAIK